MLANEERSPSVGVEESIFHRRIIDLLNEVKSGGEIKYEKLKLVIDEMGLTLRELRRVAHLYLVDIGRVESYEYISISDGPYARDSFLRSLLNFAKARSNVDVLLNHFLFSHGKVQKYQSKEGRSSVPPLFTSFQKEEVVKYLLESSFTYYDLQQILDKTLNTPGIHVFFKSDTIDGYIQIIMNHVVSRNLFQKLKSIIANHVRSYDFDANYKDFSCDYCGTVQEVGMLNSRTPNFSSCASCGSKNSFSPMVAVGEKMSDASNVRSRILEMDIEKAIQSKDERTVVEKLEELILLRKFTQLELQMWQSRLLLKYKKRYPSFVIPKLPFEFFSPISINTPSEVVEFAFGRSIADEIVSCLFPKAKNKKENIGLDDSGSRVCYCSSCYDVWFQSIAGVGLDVIELAQVYGQKKYEIPQITCGNCNSQEIFYNANFLSDLSKTSKNDGVTKENISDYLMRHFSIEEIKRLISYISGDDTIFYKIGENTIAEIIQGFINYYSDRGQITDILREIARFKFESQIGGHHIAIQCSYCNCIVATRINNEGLILIDFCPSCANDGRENKEWKVYEPIQDGGKPTIAYDLYDLHQRKSDKSTSFILHGHFLNK